MYIVIMSKGAGYTYRKRNTDVSGADMLGMVSSDGYNYKIPTLFI